MTARLPNFFLVGAVKSGSTSLYYLLDEHPSIYMSPIKEPHFFSGGDMHFNEFRPLIQKRVNSFNLQAYLSSPMKQKIHRAYISSWEDYSLLFRNVKNETAIGEASTSYLWSPMAAQRIYERIPDARIILVLRNPVERAFSHYLMDVKNGLVSGTFKDALSADEAVESPSWGKSAMYLQTGMYARQVKRYLDLFPQNHIRVILQDELKNSPADTVREIYRFLDVDPDFKPDLSIRHNISYVPSSPWAGKISNNIFLRKYLIDSLGKGIKEPLKKIFFKTTGMPGISDEEKSALIRTFEKDILDLQQLIKKDLSSWLK
jgi:hypothetical protein